MANDIQVNVKVSKGTIMRVRVGLWLAKLGMRLVSMKWNVKVVRG